MSNTINHNFILLFIDHVYDAVITDTQPISGDSPIYSTGVGLVLHGAQNAQTAPSKIRSNVLTLQFIGLGMRKRLLLEGEDSSSILRKSGLDMASRSFFTDFLNVRLYTLMSFSFSAVHFVILHRLGHSYFSRSSATARLGACR